MPELKFRACTDCKGPVAGYSICGRCRAFRQFLRAFHLKHDARSRCPADRIGKAERIRAHAERVAREGVNHDNN